MKIDGGVRGILRLNSNLRGFNIGITDGRSKRSLGAMILIHVPSFINSGIQNLIGDTFTDTEAR
jgi:hypothetical protein